MIKAMVTSAPYHLNASGKLNFLLVDDDSICLFIHRRLLELAGYSNSIQSAPHGLRALEFLEDAAQGRGVLPDIILLDLDMPLMNGIAFLEAFRNLPLPSKDRIAIVLLTSSLSDKDREYAMSLGAYRYLTKPFTREALDSLVCSLPGLPVMVHATEINTGK